MKFQQASLLALLPLLSAGETVVGVYMFHRHGDRTPKVLAPTNLTDLGYREVYTSGEYYRSRYIDSSSQYQIMGISSSEVNNLQIAASAPIDTVLQNSAQGFLQGLYPPLGKAASTQILADGKPASAPMDGYQLIPVNIVESGAGSESSGWLQDSTTCLNAEISSNNYFYSPEYMKLLDSTEGFYQKLLPVLTPLYNKTTANYFNAYLIYDYINVARIHNATLSHYGISDEEFLQLHALANVHEYNLAYNSSSTVRAIAGKQLGAEIVDFFASNIASLGENKLGIQFGAYGTFFSFFGLAQLTGYDPRFQGIVNYASAMMFELYTTEDFKTFPSPDQLRVRFLFHNGTTTNHSQPPQPYPLFGSSEMSMSWSDFQMGMGKFSVGTTRDWCHQCGNTTGSCAPFSKKFHESIQAAASSGGLSNAVSGVIGAMVTLAVVLLVELLIMLFGGFRIVKKSRMLQGRYVANGGNGVAKA